LRRRWRLLFWTLTLIAAVAAVGILRLELSRTSWVSNYIEDNHVLLTTGVLGSFTPINPMRFGLINLQVPFYTLLGSAHLADISAAAISAALLLIWLVIVWERTDKEDSFALLDIGTIAVISLFPVYHRFYDAVLLVLPLSWTFVPRVGKYRIIKVLCLLSMIPFLIPGGTLLETMQEGGHIPTTLTRHWWWDALVMPHQVWMLLILALLLMYQMATVKRREHVGIP
jgi:hypothetical protein